MTQSQRFRATVALFENRAVWMLVIGMVAFDTGCWSNPSSVPKRPDNSQLKNNSQREDASGSHQIEFEDVAATSGVVWVGRNGEEAKKLAYLETVGTGCAVDDYDGDGKLDLFFAGGGQFGPNQEILPLPIGLFRQRSSWNFQPVTDSARLKPIRHYNHGTFTADFDSDGFSDLLITGWAGLQLFHNQGDGTFCDVTDAAGLTDTLWSTAAGWGDFNRDHVLDFYVGHYCNWSFQNDPACINKTLGERNICAPTDFQGLPCTVYIGNGDGTYRDGGVELGINHIAKALGVVVADINGDCQPDIYVANDALPNQLYVSQPSGVYRESAIEYGVALGDSGAADSSMGVDLGDLDGDGRPDLWVANYEQQSFAFYRNLGNELFTHASRPFGITAVGTLAVGFGTVIFDADGDSYPDIFCANGHIWAPTKVADRRQLPYFFWNDQGKKFRNIAHQAGAYLGERHLGRGVASGDLDRNGTVDLVVTHNNEPVALLNNKTSIANLISIRLIGRVGPRTAIGAKVVITTTQRRLIGFVKGGGSYLSTSDHTVYFGIGTQNAVELIEVEWPSGQKTIVDQIHAGKSLILVESSPDPVIAVDAGF